MAWKSDAVEVIGHINNANSQMQCVWIVFILHTYSNSVDALIVCNFRHVLFNLVFALMLSPYTLMKHRLKQTKHIDDLYFTTDFCPVLSKVRILMPLATN